MKNPVLFVGGTGVVGRHAVKLFRERHPQVPILVGGRNLERCNSLAVEIGHAKAVKVDTVQPRLGLDPERSLGAIVMMTPDDGLNGMSLAQDKGIPYLSISNWLVEVGGEMAHFIHRPNSAPIVLASQWHGGPAVFLAQSLARKMDRVESVWVGAVVDELDETGPAAIEDMERGAAGDAGVWAFVNGKREWLSGHEAHRALVTLDGRPIQGDAFSPYDIVSIHALSEAKNVRFDLASTISSSRARGGRIAAELVVDLVGTVDGQPIAQRATLEFDRGQAVLTGLSTVLTLERVLGFDCHPPIGPGLYFPEMLLEAELYLNEIRRYGAKLGMART